MTGSRLHAAPRVHRLDGAATTVSVSERGARVAQVWSPGVGDWFLPSREPAAFDGVPRFDRGARSGWDDCFPSIEPVAAGEHWYGSELADDHGMLWHRRWEVRSAEPGRLRLALTDDDGPVRAEKEIRVDGTTVSTALTVENRGSESLPFLYSAHPMFAWRHDAVVHVPGGAETRRAFGAGLAWSRGADGLRLIAAHDGPAECVKFFVRWAGETTLEAGGTALRVRADARELPWLGVCVNRRAWPEPERDQHWIALEPCTAPTDALSAADGSGSDGILVRGGSRRFDIEVTGI